MKKIILLGCAFFLVYGVSAIERPAKTMAIETLSAADWVKTPSGTWEGILHGKKFFYKINATDGTLWSSADNQKWDPVKDGTWQDKSGKLLKLDGKELRSSTDGTNWSTVLDSQWESSNGTWYKFDEALILWYKTEKA